MPKPNSGETKDDFVARCIPIVMKDGTAAHNKQAAAICLSMFKQHSKGMAGKAESLRDQLDAVYHAFNAQFPQEMAQPVPMSGGYVEEVYPDYVIVELGQFNYKVSYTTAADGTIAFADQSTWEKVEEKTDWVPAAKANFSYAIKAVGDWELDVLAVPFDSKDSDGQYFDAETDTMPQAFKSPAIIYQHSVKQGATGFESTPIVIGKAKDGSLEKKADGWHIRVILDKAINEAKLVMQAVKNGIAAVSSGSIDHLARLEIGGKNVHYDKTQPGRISVWPIAEVSLWDMAGGNLRPANRNAYALPAMKAIYDAAGMTLPEIVDNPHDPETAGEAAKSTAAKRALQRRAKIIAFTLDQ
jgi:hypothetical protein